MISVTMVVAAMTKLQPLTLTLMRQQLPCRLPFAAALRGVERHLCDSNNNSNSSPRQRCRACFEAAVPGARRGSNCVSDTSVSPWGVEQGLMGMTRRVPRKGSRKHR